MVADLGKKRTISGYYGAVGVWIVWGLLVSLVGGCATTAVVKDNRVPTALETLRRAQIVDRLETLSGSADDLLAVREFFKRADSIAEVCRSIRGVLDSDTLEWVLSKVNFVSVSWELLDSLEIMKQFWTSVDELKAAPRELKMAMAAAEKDPGEANIARLSAACSSARKALERTRKVMTMLRGWVQKANIAIALAQGQLDSVEREYEGWGVSLVITGLKELLPLLGEELIKKTSRGLANLEAQLKQDSMVLEGVEKVLRPKS